MPYEIPNEADAAFGAQSELDSRDFRDMIGPAFELTGVVSGCAVTAQGTPDMTVAVAAGKVRIDGQAVAVTGGNVTITAADGTNPRFDLIVVDSTGTKSAVAGTPTVDPAEGPGPPFPDPAGKLVLATVYVPANDTAIDANQINDRRILIDDPPFENVVWYGAVLDGVTDDSAALQAAIDEGGSVWVPRGTLALAATVTLKTGAVVWFGHEVTILWTGAAAGTMFDMDTADVTQRAGIMGPMTIDPADAGVIFYCPSAQYCTFRDILVLGGTATLKVIRITAEAATSTLPPLQRNAIHNVFENVNSIRCGTLIELEGQAASTQVVTLNEFRHVGCQDVRVFGVRVVERADNNTFSGVQRYVLGADNAVGIVINDSATPTADVGAHGNVWTDYTAIVDFAFASTIGVLLNKAKQTVIKNLYADPPPDTLVSAANSDNHWIYVQGGGAADPNMDTETKNWFLKWESNILQLGKDTGGGRVLMTQVTSTPNAPGANAIKVYGKTAGLVASPALAIRAGSAGAEQIIHDRTIVPFSKQGDAEVTTGTLRWYNDLGITLNIERVTMSAGTAPTGAALIADVNINGTSIWSATQANRVTVAAGANKGTQTTFDDPTLANGEFLTVDIDQIGSTLPGSDVVVQIWLRG